MQKSRTAALHNLGCKVNAYETEAMQQLLERAGYRIVPFGEHADVCVINTCSVTNMADRKSRQMIHRARSKNPDAVIVAAGCYVQTREQEILADGAVDLVIGNNKKHELVERLEEFFRKRKEIAAVIDINDRKEEYEELSIDRTAEHTRAFLKVQDGCNQFCSYCIIPYARGRARSRRPESVVSEVRRLAENGCQEVVLTGIHLSSYGTDIGESLLRLIREVHGIEGIRRIRLGSLEPKIVTEEFAESLSRLPKLCPHFHLSLQSGCDAVLGRMNRKYTAAEYRRGCELLRSYFSHPAITTDVIVGFPGETEEEFAETERFLAEIGFYELHVFKYSVRRGTRAALMENQVPEEVKAARSARLIALGERMSGAFREYYVGTEQEVLFEEAVCIGDETCYTGYTREYVKVAKRSGLPLENALVRGTITGKLSNDLYLMQ